MLKGVNMVTGCIIWTCWVHENPDRCGSYLTGNFLLMLPLCPYRKLYDLLQRLILSSNLGTVLVRLQLLVSDIIGSGSDRLESQHSRAARYGGLTTRLYNVLTVLSIAES